MANADLVYVVRDKEHVAVNDAAIKLSKKLFKANPGERMVGSSLEREARHGGG
jgi:hypothetical protein